MTCLRKIVVATDGFASGDHAVTYALALAARHGSELAIVCAADPASQIAGLPLYPDSPDMFEPLLRDVEDAAVVVLAAALARARAAGVDARSAVLSGAPVRAIVAASVDEAADAIVLGTEAKRGLNRFCMGSTAEGVLRRATLPVFVISPSLATATPTFERALVAVDGSDASDAAMTFALQLGAEDGATLVLCAVAETGARSEEDACGHVSPDQREELRVAARTMLNANGERAKAVGVHCEFNVVEGYAAERIVAEAVRTRAGLIAIGTHGADGLGRMLLGSVAESVVRGSPVPVVVVRQASRAAERERAKAFLLPVPR